MKKRILACLVAACMMVTALTPVNGTVAAEQSTASEDSSEDKKMPNETAAASAGSKEDTEKRTEQKEPVAEKAAETEKVTERITEKVTETSQTTEKVTEAVPVTEKVTETSQATEKVTEAAPMTEKVTEAEKTTEKVTESATEAGTERVTEKETPGSTEGKTGSEVSGGTEEIPESPAGTDQATEEASGASTEKETERATEEESGKETESETESEDETEETKELSVKLKAEAVYAFVNEDSVALQAVISGGAAPYTLTLKANGKEAANESGLKKAGTKKLSWTPTEFGEYQLELTVTDAKENKAADSLKILAPVREEEKESDWTSSFANVKLTGDWRKDLVAIARTQIGYKESTRNFILNEKGEKQGYTRYGAWYGSAYEEWCAMFISFCLNYAKVPADQFPREAGCIKWREELARLQAYESDTASYIPQKGDLIFFGRESQETPDHVGIVERVSKKEGKVSTIEGNSSKEVRRREYTLTDAQIIGYGNTAKLMERSGILEQFSRLPEIPEGGIAGTTNASEINVRESAGTDGAVVAVISAAGTPVTVLAAEEVEGELWYKVQYESYTGYVREEFLEMEISETESAGSEAENTETDIAEGEIPALQIPEGGIPGTTNASEINVRESAGTDGAVIAVISAAGTGVTVLAAEEIEGVTWYKIQYGDVTGYVRGDFLDVEMPEGLQQDNEICKECGQSDGHIDTCSQYVPVCTCEAVEGEDGTLLHEEGCALYVDPYEVLFDKMISASTVEELQELMNGISKEEEEAFANALTEEQIQALKEHVQSIAAAEEQTEPHTVVFTEAGPFMPPVDVAAMFRMMRASSGDTGDGLELSKTATANEDGSYTIRMEAYTTGTVTTTTKTTPVDIVLVLDQSGSMAYGFDGNSTSDNTARRQYAMKAAVNNFIDAVAGKYSTEADHRISIVTFGSGATTLQEWTEVDSSGQTALKGQISGLPDSPSGATNVAAGMNQAESLMGSEYGYSGSNTSRQKVVIVFTDGVPTTQSDFSTDVATNAIASAKSLKDSGATVYTVGIFNGANPEQLYGEMWNYAVHQDIICEGSVGSFWGGSWVSSLVGSNDFEGIDIAAGNRFLNFLSSNFLTSTGIGLERGTYNPGDYFLAGGTGYKIIQNFDRSATSYYLTANDSSSLNGIFQTISENIQTANINLGSETIVKDTVSKYFELPADTSEIRLYTAEANEDGTFQEETAAPENVKAAIQDGAVTVTGFDYNANFVSSSEKEDGTYGKKLIIEFKVKPKSEFVGGNDVPTNDWQNSAVYDKSGMEVEKLATEGTTPTVNVPINEPEFITVNKTIYQGNSVQFSELYEAVDTTEWKYDYVNVQVTGKEGSEDTSVSPEECTEYVVKMTYTPKTDGENSSGDANDMSGKSREKEAAVHVLQPTIKANISDVKKNYGEKYVLGEGTDAVIEVAWTDKEPHENIPEVSGTKPYTEADLTLSYESDGFTGTIPKYDFDVSVTVKRGTEHMDAEIVTECDYGCETPQEDDIYTVHVQTCQLTITKNGGASDEPYVFNVLKDGVKYSEVTIVGNGEKTIYELPVGNYTIQEDEGWSWRYAPGYGQNSTGVSLTAGNPQDALTCTNTLNGNIYWLNGYSNVVTNIFGANS